MTTYERPDWLTAWLAAERRALGRSNVVFAGPAPKDFAERLLRMAGKLEAEGTPATATNLCKAMNSNLRYIADTIRRLGDRWTVGKESPSELLVDGSLLTGATPTMSGVERVSCSND